MFAPVYPMMIPAPVAPVWTLVTPGDALAVDLDTVKTFLHRPLEDTFFDDEITRFIKVATAALENHMQAVLVDSVWQCTLPFWFDRIRINKRPFTSVSQIDYVAAGTGTITTILPEDGVYVALPITQSCGMVMLGDGQQWPAIPTRQDAVRIKVRAGFETLPVDVHEALLLTIAALDGGRSEQGSGNSNQTVYAMKHTKGVALVPVMAQALVNNWRLTTLWSN
mgnify:CR=1 FL=1